MNKCAAEEVRAHLFRTHLLKAEELWDEGWKRGTVHLDTLLTGEDFRSLVYGSDFPKLIDIVERLRLTDDCLTTEELTIKQALVNHGPRSVPMPRILVVATAEGPVVLDGKLRALRALWRGDTDIGAYVFGGS